MQRLIATAAAAAVILGVMAPANADMIQPKDEASRQQLEGFDANQTVESDDVAAVKVNNRPVLLLSAVGNLDASTRANIVKDRLNQQLLPQGETYQPIAEGDITVERVNNMPVISLRQGGLITVTERDAQLAGVDVDTLADQWATSLRLSLQDVKIDASKGLPADFVAVATMPASEAPAYMGTSTVTPPSDKDAPVLENKPEVKPEDRTMERRDDANIRKDGTLESKPDGALPQR